MALSILSVAVSPVKSNSIYAVFVYSETPPSVFLTITDTFNPVLTGISVTFNGAAWTEGVNYNYSETTGEFETVLGQATVPAATYMQDPVSGAWVIEPGVSVLTVTGTV